MSGARSTLFVSVLAAACGSSPRPTPEGIDAGPDAAPPCDFDGDLDGFAASECGGPDCDDFDAAVHTTAQCSARCLRDPHAATCPCEGGPESCYSGPAGTGDVGACRSGRRSCIEGAWARCIDEQLPDEEVCDDQDDDCDGLVDEDVTNACGTCGTCQTSCAGVGCPTPLGQSWGGDTLAVDDGCFVVPPRATGGSASQVFDGGGGYVTWHRLEYKADLPGDSSIGLDVRVASSFEELLAAPWHHIDDVSPPVELQLDDGSPGEGSLLAVRVTLFTPNGESARVCQLTALMTEILLI